MFDKVAIMGNKIMLARFVIKTEEQSSITINENVNRKRGKGNPREDWIYSESEKDRKIAELKEQGVNYEIISTEISPMLEQYDGMQWNKGLKEALKMINGDPSYQIEELENKLDNDFRFKKRIDGEYTDEEWEVIAKERRTWREELRQLKAVEKAGKKEKQYGNKD